MIKIQRYLDESFYSYTKTNGDIIIPFFYESSAHSHAGIIQHDLRDTSVCVVKSDDGHGYDVIIKPAKAAKT